MRLDLAFTPDTRMPAHMYNLTTTFTSRQYDTAQTISLGNVPFVVGAGAQMSDGQNPAPVYASFAIDASAGSTQLSMSLRPNASVPAGNLCSRPGEYHASKC